MISRPQQDQSHELYPRGGRTSIPLADEASLSNSGLGEAERQVKQGTTSLKESIQGEAERGFHFVDETSLSNSGSDEAERQSHYITDQSQ